ncbi:MAG: sugar phosphate isomerase/epimerase [Treponema sp.]|nr:sugar phosphate isomerase/epimerase [Treponema sp.]
MKKSINAWTVDEETGFEQMFREISEAGFRGIELNVDRDDHSAHSITLDNGTDLESIAKLAEKYSLPVVSISTSLGGGTGTPGAGFQRAHKVIRRQIECAKALNAKFILSVPGGAGSDLSIKDAYTNNLECYREIGDEIAASGIYVCLEQVWNGFFTSPFDMANFIDKLDNPGIAAYFDAGNMIAFSWPEHWIEILGGRIRALHVKNFKRAGGLFRGGSWVDLEEGDADWKKIIGALRKTGFDGYLTAETSITESRIPGINFCAYYKDVADALGRIIAI